MPAKRTAFLFYCMKDSVATAALGVLPPLSPPYIQARQPRRPREAGLSLIKNYHHMWEDAKDD